MEDHRLELMVSVLKKHFVIFPPKSKTKIFAKPNKHFFFENYQSIMIIFRAEYFRFISINKFQFK
jgi:hypothetical protein